MINAKTKTWSGLWSQFHWVRAFASREALLPLTLLVAGGWRSADAQPPLPQAPVPPQVAAPSAPNKHYMTKSSFSLPVQIDDRVRDSLREVQLYMKEPESKNWTILARGTPQQTNFSVKLERDGEFWFTVVTVDKQNRFTPADLFNQEPQIIVVQDTTPPQLEVRTIPMAAEGVCVRCEIKDANPDLAKTRLEYQTEDKVYRGADPVPGQPDTFVIPAQARFSGMVKASVADRAGNVTTREVNLPTSTAPLPVPPVPKDVVMEKGPGQAPTLPVDPPHVSNKILPDLGPSQIVPPVVPSQGGPAAIVPPVVPSSVAPFVPAPPVEVKPGAPRTSSGGPERHIVNQSQVSLEYQIEDQGPSGVGKVEAWITTDECKTWRRHSEDKDRRSPIDLDLPGEGVYGVRLVVTNGGGFGGTPPKAGDLPDWWIEVDKTKPLVDGLAAKINIDNTTELLIAWNAKDKNFGPEPIDLFFAAQREGPWAPIAKGLKNDGRHRWVLPQNVGLQTYLRVVATDLAGNTSSVETPQAVTLDDHSRPHARVLGVMSTPLKAAPTGN